MNEGKFTRNPFLTSKTVYHKLTETKMQGFENFVKFFRAFLAQNSCWCSVKAWIGAGALQSWSTYVDQLAH